MGKKLLIASEKVREGRK